MKKLSEFEIRRRAKQITLVLTDVDGVLTDTGVYYSANGEELKRFSIRDGMGMDLLREQGIETAMMTREDSPRDRRSLGCPIISRASWISASRCRIFWKKRIGKFTRSLTLAMT